MVREIRIYIEGGGDQAATKRSFERGFGAFFNKFRESARLKKIRWRVIACGSRNSTFDDFQIALRAHPQAVNLLLVDAECELSDPSPRKHLLQRDGWKIDQLLEDDCHLMIQCMESWMIADVEALTNYYGKGFRASSIPRAAKTDVESISKDTVFKALQTATRQSKKGSYHKSRHAPSILEAARIDIVGAHAPHCLRLVNRLEQLIAGSA